MKSIFTLALLVSSLSASAITLSNINIIREGGGQLEAIVADSDEGLEITLKSCNFREVANGIAAKVKGKEIAEATLAILKGKAILAEDVTPRPLMPSGSWQRLSFTYNTSQFPEMSARYDVTKKLQQPIVIIDGKVSNVVSELESQARSLCKKN